MFGVTLQLLRLYNDLLVATDRGQVSGICLLETHGGVRHSRPRTAATSTRSHVWSPGSGQGMVQVLPDRQIVLRCIRREDLDGYPSNVLRTAGFSIGPTVVYSVYSGPSRPRLKVRRQAARIR